MDQALILTLLLSRGHNSLFADSSKTSFSINACTG